jgi:hypothetical protein
MRRWRTTPDIFLPEWRARSPTNMAEAVSIWTRPNRDSRSKLRSRTLRCSPRRGRHWSLGGRYSAIGPRQFAPRTRANITPSGTRRFRAPTSRISEWGNPSGYDRLWRFSASRRWARDGRLAMQYRPKARQIFGRCDPFGHFHQHTLHSSATLKCVPKVSNKKSAPPRGKRAFSPGRITPLSALRGSPSRPISLRHSQW